MSGQVKKLNMPLPDWIEISKILSEFEIDPEPYMLCEHYGKLRYELALLRLGEIEAKNFPGPEKYRYFKPYTVRCKY